VLEHSRGRHVAKPKQRSIHHSLVPAVADFVLGFGHRPPSNVEINAPIAHGS
jgi:hypothetical protein